MSGLVAKLENLFVFVKTLFKKSAQTDGFKIVAD